MSRLIYRNTLLLSQLATRSRLCIYLTPARRAWLSINVLRNPVTIKRSISNSIASNAKESTELKADMMKFLFEHNQRPIPTTDKHVVLTHCPHCLHVKKHSFAAHLNLVKGAYECTTCHAKGSFQEFSKTLVKKLRKPNEGFEIVTASDVMHGKTHALNPADVEQYTQLLSKEPATLDYLCSTHHINKDIWQLYQVGTTTVDNKPYLTFPQTTLSYDPTCQDLFKLDTVRLKVCNLDNPSALLHMDPPAPSKEGSAGLFGYQTASFESDTLIVTRRELDAMAAYQATGIPSVSIPTANYQLQESVLPLLERFTRIYLWLDDDVDGQLAAERFAHKLGDSKCLLVHTRQGAKQGPLTAHEALKANKDLKAMIKSARRIKHDQIIDFHDLRQEVYNEILHPDQTRGIQSRDLPKLNSILKGHRSGELTILTGPTGAGKTTIVSQLSLDYCQSGVPTLWGSFEIMNKRLAKKMLYQFAGKDVSLVPEEFDAIADKFQELPLYFLKFFSSTAIDEVLKACHHAVYAYDVRHIILDNLQFMLSQQGRGSLDKWEIQDHAIAEIRRFATEQDVHVTLVVHPRKEMGEELDIHSIFGSAKVTQEADNVVIIQKKMLKDERSLDIKKNRFDGTLGTVPYKFDRSTNKIREYTEEEEKERKKGGYRTSSETRTIIRKK